MSTEQTSASSSSKNSTKLAKLSGYTKFGVQGVFYGMLFAGALGAAATAVMNKLELDKSEKAHRTMMQSIVGEACMPNGAYRGYYIGLGDDINLAAGMLLQHPKKFQEVCAAITASMSIRESEPKNQVHVLASVFGVTEQVANAAIEQEKLNLAVKEKKSEVQQPYTNTDFSGPSR